MSGRLFQRRRDGRVEVRLNEIGRSVVRDAAQRIVQAERGEDGWSSSVRPPIVPERDDDDPLRILERDTAVTTQAELVLVTVEEALLSADEAWAWLVTLQVALRATADEAGLAGDDEWGRAEAPVRERVEGLQMLLWGLADCL